MCSKSFNNHGTLSHHKKIHNPENVPWIICTQIFINKSHLKKNTKDQSIIQILQIVFAMYAKSQFQNWRSTLKEYTKRNDSLVNIAQKNSLIRKIATNIQYPYILMNAILGVIPTLEDTSTLQNKRPHKKSAHCWLRFSLSKLWVQV